MTRRIAAFCLLSSLTLGRPSAVAAADLIWQRLGPLPDPIGVAGACAGVSGGALIVAGGANFPTGPPWENGQTVWRDGVFVLETPGGEWREPASA